MTDWETFFGIAGVYILLLGIFVHDFIVSRELIKINKTILENTKTNQKILQLIKSETIVEPDQTG